jgi:dihydroflavonol-4-reductase
MNLVRALVRAGHDVVATRREMDNTLFARKLGARLEVAELDEVEGMTRLMRGRDVLFMCAGHYPRWSLDPEADVALAREQVRNSIEAARKSGIGRYVLTSSVATVGPAREGRALSNETDPMSRGAHEGAYHGVKFAIEQEVLAASATGLDCVVVNPTGLIGELDVKAGTGFIIVAIGHGRLPFYIEGRTNIVDADEMAQAHIAAAERGRSGQRYIAGGHNTTIRHFMGCIADELGVPLHSWRLPLWVAGAGALLDEMRCVAVPGSTRLFLAREFVDIVRHGHWVDRTRSASELGLPEPAPLASTIRKACQWYERHGYLKRRQRA